MRHFAQYEACSIDDLLQRHHVITLVLDSALSEEWSGHFLIDLRAESSCVLLRSPTRVRDRIAKDGPRAGPWGEFKRLAKTDIARPSSTKLKRPLYSSRDRCLAPVLSHNSDPKKTRGRRNVASLSERGDIFHPNERFSAISISHGDIVWGSEYPAALNCNHPFRPRA